MNTPSANICLLLVYFCVCDQFAVIGCWEPWWKTQDVPICLLLLLHSRCRHSVHKIGRDMVQLARTYLAFGTHVVCMLGIGADATVSYWQMLVCLQHTLTRWCVMRWWDERTPTSNIRIHSADAYYYCVLSMPVFGCSYVLWYRLALVVRHHWLCFVCCAACDYPCNLGASLLRALMCVSIA